MTEKQLKTKAKYLKKYYFDYREFKLDKNLEIFEYDTHEFKIRYRAKKYNSNKWLMLLFLSLTILFLAVIGIGAWGITMAREQYAKGEALQATINTLNKGLNINDTKSVIDISNLVSPIAEQISKLRIKQTHWEVLGGCGLWFGIPFAVLSGLFIVFAAENSETKWKPTKILTTTLK